MAVDQTWDDFWAEVHGAQKPRMQTIRGVTVRVPTDVPLSVEKRAEDLSAASYEEVAELVTDLFGKDVLGTWEDAGMGSLEFQTILAWALAQGRGLHDVTFADAYREIVAADGGDEGKPPAPEGAKKTASRQRSKSTGGR